MVVNFLSLTPALLLQTYNLGSGVGVSVIQLVQTFGKVTSTKVPYELKPRREGDICAMYSNGERAKQELGWIPRFTLEQMCKFDNQIDSTLPTANFFLLLSLLLPVVVVRCSQENVVRRCH